MKRLFPVVLASVVMALVVGCLSSAPAETPSPQSAVASAKEVMVENISYPPDNLPPPIIRLENQTVVVELQTKEVIAEMMSGVTY